MDFPGSTLLSVMTALPGRKFVPRAGAWLLALTALLGCEQPVNYSSFAMFQSLEHDKVVIVELAPPDLAYGPTQVRVSISEGTSGAVTEVLTTKLSNDGTTITHENLKGQWQNADTLLLCFAGAEQSDAAFELNVVSASYVTTELACVDN